MIHMTPSAWLFVGVYALVFVFAFWPKRGRVRDNGYQPGYTEHPTIPHVYMPARRPTHPPADWSSSWLRGLVTVTDRGTLETPRGVTFELGRYPDTYLDAGDVLRFLAWLDEYGTTSKGEEAPRG